MIGNDWDEKLNIIWHSEGFKKFYNLVENEYQTKTIFPPNFSSSSNPFTVSFTLEITFTYAVPPPGKIPSSTAAFVAASASSILSFFSFISIHPKLKLYNYILPQNTTSKHMI